LKELKSAFNDGSQRGRRDIVASRPHWLLGPRRTNADISAKLFSFGTYALNLMPTLLKLFQYHMEILYHAREMSKSVNFIVERRLQKEEQHHNRD